MLVFFTIIIVLSSIILVGRALSEVALNEREDIKKEDTNGTDTTINFD